MKKSSPLRLVRTLALSYAAFWALSIALGRASKFQV